MTIRTSLLFTALLALVLGVLPAQAAPVEAGLAAGAAVHPQVQSQLGAGDAVPVTLTLVLPPATDPAFLSHPAADSGVHPFVVDLTTMAANGTARLGEDVGPFGTFHGTFGPAAIAALTESPWVLSIDPGSEKPSPGGDGAMTMAGCTPTSTQACVQGNRFGITATIGSTTGRVAATSSESAVFWAFGAANWEAVVKVLDGCSINNFWWVFAGKATGMSYSFTVRDFHTSTTYPFPVAACPVTDTAAIPCP